jgi:hypothetical protein
MPIVVDAKRQVYDFAANGPIKRGERSDLGGEWPRQAIAFGETCGGANGRMER